MYKLHPALRLAETKRWREREVHHEFELSSDVTVDDGCAAVNLGFSILRRPQFAPPHLLFPLPPSFLSLPVSLSPPSFPPLLTLVPFSSSTPYLSFFFPTKICYYPSITLVPTSPTSPLTPLLSSLLSARACITASALLLSSITPLLSGCSTLHTHRIMSPAKFTSIGPWQHQTCLQTVLPHTGKLLIG